MFTTPLEVEAAFYQAMRQADLNLMMRVWATEEDTICIHPGGMHAMGFDAIHTAWQQIFAAGPVQIRPLSTGMTLPGETTVAHSIVEEITLPGLQGDTVRYCYATHIFQRTAHGWKMVLHHSSQAPHYHALFDTTAPSHTLH